MVILTGFLGNFRRPDYPKTPVNKLTVLVKRIHLLKYAQIHARTHLSDFVLLLSICERLANLDHCEP